MNAPNPKAARRPASPAPVEPQPEVRLQNAPGLGRMLAEHVETVTDFDVSPVKPSPGAGNSVRFYVDDAEWEYQVTVQRVRRSLS